jgi:hypothetical protein
MPTESYGMEALSKPSDLPNKRHLSRDVEKQARVLQDARGSLVKDWARSRSKILPDHHSKRDTTQLDNGDPILTPQQSDPKSVFSCSSSNAKPQAHQIASNSHAAYHVFFELSYEERRYRTQAAHLSPLTPQPTHQVPLSNRASASLRWV